MDKVMRAGFLKEIARALGQVEREREQKIRELLGALIEEAEKDIQAVLLFREHQQDQLKKSVMSQKAEDFARVIGRELAGRELKQEAAQLKTDPLRYTTTFEDY
jgi:hypothetical protein